MVDGQAAKRQENGRTVPQQLCRASARRMVTGTDGQLTNAIAPELGQHTTAAAEAEEHVQKAVPGILQSRQPESRGSQEGDC